MLRANALQRPPDRLIRRNAAGDGEAPVIFRQPVRNQQFHRCPRLRRQKIARRRLKRGAKVAPLPFRDPAFFSEFVARPQHRRFQPGERHVASGPVDQRPGKDEAGLVARIRRALHLWAARIAKAEYLRDLVERLPRRVVDRPAEAAVFAGRRHMDQLAMPARDQEQQIGAVHPFGQAWGQRVTLQMVHPDQRLARAKGDPFGAHHPRQHPADQPRPRRRRDEIHLGKRNPGLRQRRLRRDIEHFGMCAGGDFRHDAAIGAVQLLLPRHDIGQDIARPLGPAIRKPRPHHGGAGVVATRFEREDGDGLAHRHVVPCRDRADCAALRHGVTEAGMNTQTPTPENPLRLGTRGSPLALAQAVETRDRLAAAHGLPQDAFAIEVIKTTGDAVQDRPLSEIGGKGLFTKEIEQALYDGRIDIAVHSMKDVATVLPEGMEMIAHLPREDVRDAFISADFAALDDLPQGAVLGTSSLRRRAQALARRPDLQLVEFRGNVQTRMKKLADGVASATFLACAGLNRLGGEIPEAKPISEDVMLPAVAQGAIGIEARSDDERARALLAPLDDEATTIRLTAERAFLRALDGSCRTPIAGLAEIVEGNLRFRGEIIRPDGSETHATARTGALSDAEAMGLDAAEELKARGGPGFFAW